MPDLQCHWCGGPMETDFLGTPDRRKWFVACKRETECGATSPYRPTEAEAIAAWGEVGRKK